MKDQSKMYFNYFTKTLKQPAAIFNTGEREFVNGLISIIALGVIIALTLFVWVNSFVGGWFYDTSDIFVNVFFGSLFYALILFIIVIVSIWIGAKLFSSEKSWKELFSYFGGLIAPSIILTVLALLLILIKAFEFGYYILLIALLISLFAAPLFILTRVLSSKSKNLDAYNAYLVTIVIYVALNYIAYQLIFNNTIGKFLN